MINTLLSAFKSPPLKFRASNVLVTRAPAPREVIWENLSNSFLRSFLAEVLFVATMVIVLYFSFRFQYRIIDLAYALRHQSSKSKEAIEFIEALAVSLIVVIVNSLLRLLVNICLFRLNYLLISKGTTLTQVITLLSASTTRFLTSSTLASWFILCMDIEILNSLLRGKLTIHLFMTSICLCWQMPFQNLCLRFLIQKCGFELSERTTSPSSPLIKTRTLSRMWTRPGKDMRFRLRTITNTFSECWLLQPGLLIRPLLEWWYPC